MLKLVAHLVTTIRLESSVVLLGTHSTLFIQTLTRLIKRVQREANRSRVYFSF